MKNREIDLLIVVNMFLTGFDATTLNTLWVDKNLRQHGLIQAFSRTNRILNSIKQYGNIVCFRDLEEETNQAIALFGNKEARGTVLIKTFDEYYYGYNDGDKRVEGYLVMAERLLNLFPLDDFRSSVLGEENEKAFITLFGNILKLKNILSSFDDFEGKHIFKDHELQNYMSEYVDLYEEYKRSKKLEKVSILNDIEFQIELIKQIEVNIDYILALIFRYHSANCKDKEILKNIEIAIGSSIELRSKRELIEGFIQKINASDKIEDAWSVFVKAQKEKDLDEIITVEKLDKEKTIRYIDLSLDEGEMKTSGTTINEFLGTGSWFGSGTDDRIQKKHRVIEKLKALFEKYVGV
jgi:type I restriction enzyme R subunit